MLAVDGHALPHNRSVHKHFGVPELDGRLRYDVGGEVDRVGKRSRLVVTVAWLSVLVLSPAICAAAHDASPPDLSGRWITLQRFVAIADFPFLGEVALQTTVGLLSEISQDGSCLTLSDAYCFSDVDVSTDLFVTDVPDVAMQSIEPEARAAEIRIETNRIRIVQDWQTEVRGAVLDDPTNDALPTYRSDPRVIDMDGDGQPGFTIPAAIVDLFGGDTYVVQRFRYRLEGILVDPNTIIGLIEWSTEQVVLWATDALLMLPYGQSIDPDPTVHRFLMRRIDETWTCNSIRERAAPLLELLDASGFSESV